MMSTTPTGAATTLTPLTSIPGYPMPSGAPAVMPTVSTDTQTHVTVPQVKIPKLNMKRFNGDMTKWTTFWDSFAFSIHDDSALSSIDKFSYLISLLESTAAEAIASLTPTDANYKKQWQP